MQIWKRRRGEKRVEGKIIFICIFDYSVFSSICFLLYQTTGGKIYIYIYIWEFQGHHKKHTQKISICGVYCLVVCYLGVLNSCYRVLISKFLWNGFEAKNDLMLKYCMKWISKILLNGIVLNGEMPKPIFYSRWKIKARVYSPTYRIVFTLNEIW